METKKPFNFGESIYATIVAAYLLPVIFYGHQSVAWISSAKSWQVLSVGLVLSLFGSALLILLVRRWEVSMHHQFAREQAVVNRVSVSEEATEEVSDVNDRAGDETRLLREALQNSEMARGALTDEVEALRRQLQSDADNYQQQLALLRQEGDSQRQGARDLLLQKEAIVTELETTIQQLRSTLEEKVTVITKLEGKISDLNYEVKTLLQLGDMTQPNGNISSAALEELYGDPPDGNEEAPMSFDASAQLKRCIETAERQVGAAHLSSSGSRLKELSMDSMALDLRRLSDSLRNETSSALAVYSKHEDRLLFTNNHIKGLLGWGPDKFTKDFYSLLQQGESEWRQAMAALTPGESVQVTLVIKTKSGHDVLMQCHAGVIGTGIFADHIILILEP